jgi:hypothetical protein
MPEADEVFTVTRQELEQVKDALLTIRTSIAGRGVRDGAFRKMLAATQLVSAILASGERRAAPAPILRFKARSTLHPGPEAA